MTNKINAATLVNRVIYSTDRASLKRVRAELKSLQNQFSKNATMQSKQTIANAKAAAIAQVAAARSTAIAQKQANQTAQQSANQAAKQQRAQQAAQQKIISAQLKQREKAQKAADKAKQTAQTRDQRATLKLKDAAFSISRMQGLDGAQRYAAIQQAKQLTDQYRKGAIDLAEMNQQMKFLRVNTSAAARQARNLSRKQGQKPATGNSKWLVGAALTGVVGGGAYAVGRGLETARDTLSEATERNADRLKLRMQGISPAEGDAIIQQVYARTGTRLSREQLADQAKDFQEKAGEASQGTFKKQKDGSYNFSGGGELSDLIQAITNKGGVDAGKQVQQNIQSMNWPQFLVYAKQLQNQFGFTQKEMTFFTEAINDGSLTFQAIDANGKNVTDAMKRMAESGLAATNQQIDAIQWLSSLSSVTQQASENLGDAFSAAFADKLKSLDVNADSAIDAFSETKPIVEEFGRSLASLTSWAMSILKHIPGSKTYNENAYRDAQDNYNEHKDDSALSQWFWKRWSSNSTAGDQGWQDAAKGLNRQSPVVNMATGENSNMFSNGYAQRQMPPINNNLQMKIQVVPDGSAFGNAVSAHATDIFNNGINDISFDMNSSMLRG